MISRHQMQPHKMPGKVTFFLLQRKRRYPTISTTYRMLVTGSYILAGSPILLLSQKYYPWCSVPLRSSFSCQQRPAEAAKDNSSWRSVESIRWKPTLIYLDSQPSSQITTLYRVSHRLVGSLICLANDPPAPYEH